MTEEKKTIVTEEKRTIAAGEKKAIVTGGSRGIGRGIVLELAARGYQVVFSYNTDQGAAEKVTEEVRSKYHRKCTFFQASFQNKGAGEEFFHKAVDCLGGLDVLVNNAGVTRFESLTELKAETLEFLVQLDFMNYIRMMQSAACYMKEHGIRGSIVNITSSRGERAYPGDGIYGGCKAALNRAIESFALDLAPYGIRVNNVAPGSIQVRQPEELSGKRSFMIEVYRQLGQKVPLGRMGTPEDIAKAAAFLASEDASYITGVTLRVDGGLILPGMPERQVDANSPWGQY